MKREGHKESSFGDDNDKAIIDSIKTEMKNLFGDDPRRIEHTLKVTGYAEEIRRAEGGSAAVVQAAGLLHDIGIPAAERKHGSSAGVYQEMEGPPIAREILTRLEMSAEDVEHVCRIIGSHHSAGDIDTLEFRIIWDADWLVNLPREQGDAPKADLAERIEHIFRTAKGKEIARRILLTDGPHA